QGLFDMPTFITSIKDYKKLSGKTAFCTKIYFKLMDVWRYPIAIKPRKRIPPKTKKIYYSFN
ncbi:hypothetical protein BHU24_01465, partial [Bacillus pseudomycoides]|nr:hypothetical protein [Bacillus pseudomycoides]